MSYGSCGVISSKQVVGKHDYISLIDLFTDVQTAKACFTSNKLLEDSIQLHEITVRVKCQRQVHPGQMFIWLLPKTSFHNAQSTVNKESISKSSP